MKAIIYKILAYITYRLRFWRMLYFLFPVFWGKYILTVLTFHRIVPSEKTKSLVAYYDIGYDNKLYESLLEELSHYFDFVSLDDFIKYASGEEKPRRHSMLITFDDADFELMTYATPILFKNNWPAVVFAPTAYIGTDKVFWHLKITDMMFQMDDSKWQILKRHKDVFPQGIQDILEKHHTYDDSLHRAVCFAFLIYFNQRKDYEIEAAIGRFEELIGSQYSLGIKCLDWDQLAELEGHGIEVESHTVAHDKLAHLDDERALAEIRESKSVLEAKLNKTVKALCYPAGSYNHNTRELVRRAGYKAAFTTKPGNVRYPLQDQDFYVIPRNAFGGNNPIEMNWEIGKLLIKYKS